MFVLVGALLAIGSSAPACRYNVRDVGFVDLGNSAYELRFPSPVEVETVQSRAFLSNIVLSNRKLPSEASQPQVVLLSPDQRKLVISATPVKQDKVLTTYQACISDYAQGLIKRLINCHSVILIAEGADTEQNKRAAKIAQRTVKEVLATRSLWPKPIENGPEIVTLARSEQAKYKTMLWSLGVSPTNSETQVLVLFGRGRRLGDVLDINQVEEGALTRLLNIVSIDCECDFNVARLIGPMLPHVWDEQLEQLASDSLGFDPGQPLVKVEVEQILARWPREEGENNSLPPERMALGYVEIALPTGDEDMGDEEVGIVEMGAVEMGAVEVGDEVLGDEAARTAEMGAGDSGDAPSASTPVNPSQATTTAHAQPSPAAKSDDLAQSYWRIVMAGVLIVTAASLLAATAMWFRAGG